jgi:hypothetical protein
MTRQPEESNDEKLSRVSQMIDPRQQTWVFSPNDVAAIRYVHELATRSEHPADDDEPVTVEWATQMYGKPSRSSGDYYHKWDVNEAASFCFFRDVFAVTFFDDENSVDVPVTTRRQLRSLLSALNPESE